MDDDLPLNKTTETHDVTIVVGAVFHENNKYYPQVLFTSLNVKMHIMVELTLLKKLMLIKQANQKSAISFTIGIF